MKQVREREKVRSMEHSRDRWRPREVPNRTRKKRPVWRKVRESLGTEAGASPGYLDPGKEKVDSVHIVVLCLPEGQELKVCISVWLLQELSQQSVYFQGSEDVETHGHYGELSYKSHGECQRS